MNAVQTPESSLGAYRKDRHVGRGRLESRSDSNADRLRVPAAGTAKHSALHLSRPACAGAASEVQPLVEELRRRSPEFDAMWDDNEVHGPHGEAVKQIRHPALGRLAFEVSAFSIDGRTDLSMVVYNPATPDDARRVESLLAEGAPREN